MSWQIIGRHRWLVGTLITESVNDDDTARRYTATIRGSRNWRVFQGPGAPGTLDLIIRIVCAIRDQIDADGEDCEAFMAVNEYCRDVSELEERAKMFEHPISEALDEYLAVFAASSTQNTRANFRTELAYKRTEKP